MNLYVERKGDGILFSDLFDLEDLQRLQDIFSETNEVASIITHPDGKPITKPSNFTRLCGNIIRKTEKGCVNCYKSDAIIGRHNPLGPIIQPCFSGGLWEAGASITVGDKHVANWLIGQVRNSKLDEKQILEYADVIDANKDDFREALKEVPEMSLERFKKIANMLFAFACEISEKAFNILQLKIQVEEREKATGKLGNNNIRLQSIVNILQHNVNNVQDFLDYALEELIKITDSKIGYIYFYDADKQEFILNSWSKEVMKECAVKNPQTVYSLEKTGLWGEVVRQGKAIINNNFEEFHPHKKGYPEGHVKLKKFLTIPVFYNNRIVAVAGVANKTNDYDQTDVLQMTLLMNSVWKTTERIKADQALQESEERWRKAVAGSPIPIMIHDEDGKILQVSEGWSLFSGYSIDEIPTITDWIEKAFGKKFELAKENISQLFNINKTVKIGERIITAKDGSKRNWDFQTTPLGKSYQGKRILQSVAIDVTESKLAEEAFKLEQKFSESLLNSLPGIFYLYSYPKMQLVRWNKNHETIFGYNSTELKNMPVEKWYKPENKTFAHEALKEVIEKSHIMVEAPLYTKDGREIPFLLTGVSIDVQDKQYVMGVGFDITDRKKAESELQEKEVQYRNLANSGMAMIWTSGPDKLCNYFNDPWLKFTGRSLEQELGNGWAEGVHPDDIDYCINTYLSAFDKRESFEMEYRLRNASGEYKWLLDKGSPNYNSEGTFIGYIGYCFDISELKQAEEEIKSKNEKLQQINVEKDKFLSIISHDLRSPFNSFLGLTELMAEDFQHLTREQLEKMVFSLKNSATNLYRLLENLLQWSKIQRGLIPFKPERIELRALVTESIYMVKEPAKNKNIDISIDVPANQSIFADRNILQTIIRNLVSNSIKFTPKGGKVVISSAIGSSKETEIIIADTGIGMNQQEINNLFQIDMQNNRKGTEGEASTGLGLIICKELIARHGGILWLESEEGKGSVFHFSVPGSDEKNKNSDVK